MRGNMDATSAAPKSLIHPDQTLNMDYSLTQVFPLKGDLRLQLGLIGYGQWQTTDRHGPTITPEESRTHEVNGLGFAANAIFPGRKASIGLKYFHEFQCRSTYQGYTCKSPARLPSDPSCSWRGVFDSTAILGIWGATVSKKLTVPVCNQLCEADSVRR